MHANKTAIHIIKNTLEETNANTERQQNEKNHYNTIIDNHNNDNTTTDTAICGEW